MSRVRLRDVVDLAPQPAPPKPAPKPKSSPAFICWPQPPTIRHRGASGETGLTALESCLAGALSFLGRQELKKLRHAYALKHGKAHIDKLRSKRRAGDAVRWARHEPSTNAELFRAHGSGGYARGVAKFNQQSTDYTVEASPSALLALAGLSAGGPNCALVPSALNRLSQTVGDRPPPLRSWQWLPSGRLQLVIDNYWVPIKGFVLVPWPPPTKGSATTTLALYYFLCAIDQRSKSKINITLARLYQQLGIRVVWPAHAKRSLDRALTGVNDHLATLGQTMFFKMIQIEGDRVRFVVEKRKSTKATRAAAARERARP